MSIGLKLSKYEDNSRSQGNRTYQYGHGYHVALVLPVDNPAIGTTTAQKSMGVLSLTVAARSCDGFKHRSILASCKINSTDPHQIVVTPVKSPPVTGFKLAFDGMCPPVTIAHSYERTN